VKLVSDITGQEIVIHDVSQLYHFRGGYFPQRIIGDVALQTSPPNLHSSISLLYKELHEHFFEN